MARHKAHVALSSGDDFVADVERLTPSSIYLQTPHKLAVNARVTVTFFSVSVDGIVALVTGESPPSAVVQFSASADTRALIAERMKDINVAKPDDWDDKTAPIDHDIPEPSRTGLKAALSSTARIRLQSEQTPISHSAKTNADALVEAEEYPAYGDEEESSTVRIEPAMAAKFGEFGKEEKSNEATAPMPKARNRFSTIPNEAKEDDEETVLTGGSPEMEDTLTEREAKRLKASMERLGELEHMLDKIASPDADEAPTLGLDGKKNS